jgi:hypothetical protein
MSKYTPYKPDASFTVFVLLNMGYVVASLLILWALGDRGLPAPLRAGGIFLFLIGAVMASIVGLATAPDFSEVVFQHPEREYFRYIALGIGACCLGVATPFLVGYFKGTKQLWALLLGLLVPSVLEMLWEFHHQFSYADELRVWMDQGHKSSDFNVHYFNDTIVKIGAVARILQYSSILCLLVLLRQAMRMPIGVILILSLFGLAALSVNVFILVKGLEFPKGYEAMFLAFIPGLPFILLYWISAGILAPSDYRNTRLGALLGKGAER